MLLNDVILVCIVCHLFCFVSSQHRFGCYDSYCSKEAPPCPDLNCEDGRILKNATRCGCCHLCVKPLGEGETCKMRDYGSIPRTECGPRLICEKNKCVPAKTQCMMDLKDFDEVLPFGKTKPECDDFGFYTPTICISDVLCYCVDKKGKRIFGTDIASRKNSMHCNCSREFEEFSKKVEFPKDDFLRCLPNGNYDLLQCTEDTCYCMQDQKGAADFTDNTNIKNLLCYADRHKNDDEFLRSKCQLERQKLLKQVEEYEAQQITVIGVDLPQCDLDGSYAPVQCKKDSCYCVKTTGKMIAGTKVKRNSEYAKQMNCRCVREKEMLLNEKDKNKNMNTFMNFKCAPNGNYETKQNVEQDKVITIDSEMGFQTYDI